MILFPVLFLALVLVRPKRFQTNGSWWQLQPLPSPWMTRIWRPLVSSFQCLENPNQIQPLDLAGGVCVATSFEDPTGTGGSPGNKKRKGCLQRFQVISMWTYNWSSESSWNVLLIVHISAVCAGIRYLFLTSYLWPEIQAPDSIWKGLHSRNFQSKGSVSGGSQCRCESGNDCASGPRKNREGAFRMDEGIEIHSHVVKQHFGHIVILATRFMMQ